MPNLRQKILFTTLLLSGMGTIALLPAAQATDLKNISIGGSNPSDYFLYDATATETFLNPNASLQTILSGDKNSPTGNIELAASSEQVGFDFSKQTSLNGTIGGRIITVSSLTESDWNATYKDTNSTFGQHWFNQALSSNGFASLTGTTTADYLFNAFKTNGGFQRFSDPNISYINQDTTGDISVGLAGHYNASPLFTKSIDQYLSTTKVFKPGEKATLSALKTQLANTAIQASEVFKYEYNGLSDYGYSFQATQSGLTERGDHFSHTGNYEIVIKGPEAIKHVPEPGMMLGLVGVSGLAAWKRRRTKSTGL